MKRTISVLLMICLLVAFAPTTVLANELEKTEITLNTYNSVNQSELQISGIYCDNNFYVPAEALCELLEGEIWDDDDDYSNGFFLELYSFGGVSNCFVIMPQHNQMMDLITEDIFISNISLPAIKSDGEYLLSLVDFFEYLDCNYYFLPNAQFQLIFGKYDIYDAINEWKQEREKADFYVTWTQFFCDANLRNVSLVSILDEDASPHRLIFDTDGIVEEIADDVILSIIQNMGQTYSEDYDNLNSFNHLLTKIVGYEGEVFSFAMDSKANQLESLSSTVGGDVLENSSKVFSESVRTIGDVAGDLVYTADIITNFSEALYLYDTYTNMGVNQREVLPHTLVKYKERLDVNAMDNPLISAATDLSLQINGGESLAFLNACQESFCDTMKYFSEGTAGIVVGTDAMLAVTALYESLNIAMDINRLLGSGRVIDAKAQVYDAYICWIYLIYSMQVINEIDDVIKSMPLSNKERVNMLYDMKQAFLLDLNAAYVMQNNLIESGYLNEAEKQQLAANCDKLIYLINRFEDCTVPDYIGEGDNEALNISWMADYISADAFDETAAYMEFLNTKGYTEYMSDWCYNEPREYAILDIDADNCAELIVSGNDGLEFCNFIVFSYNAETSEILPLTFIDRTGGYEGDGYVNQFYQDLFLSKYQNALVFESLNNGTAFEYLEYWMIEESEVTRHSTIYYDPYYGTYHYGEFIGNSEKELTEDDYIQRKSELTLVEFLPIPTSSSDIGTEIVSDAWNKNGSRIPKINLDSPTIEQLNETIYSDLEAEGFFEGFDYDVAAVDYRWYHNGDVLSIIVEQFWNGGFGPTSVYNVSVDGKTELSPGALINNVLSLDWDTYEEQVRAAIASTFCDVFCGVDASYKTTLEPYMMQMFENAISDATVESALPYLNENGELCIIVEFASIAGPSTIYYDINLETYETSPYVESMMDALGGNTVSNSAMEEVLEQYLIACFYADGDAFAELLIPGLLEYMMVTENWTRAELVDDLTDLLTDWMGYDEMEGYDALWPYNFIPPDQLEISYSIERETALTSAEFNDMRNQYEQILDITISELKILEVSFRAIDKTNSSISLNAVGEVCLIITGKGCYIMPG